jgi:hypothetical protein
LASPNIDVIFKYNKNNMMMRQAIKNNTLTSVFKQTLIGTTALASVVLFLAATVIALYKAAGM